MTDKQWRYFFSHAGSDRDVAAEIAQALVARGIPTWCDALPDALIPGKPWVEQLEEALAACGGYLILVHGEQVERWVRAELDYALNRQALAPDFRVVPILLGDTEPTALPPFLQRFQAVRLASTSPGHLSTAIDRIQALDAEAPSPSGGVGADCPFPGLEAFDENTARFFFGRDQEVRALCRQLGRTPRGHRRWLQIEGPSGSGKSSLTQAGLVPAVLRGWLEHTPLSWAIAIMRPGQDPVVNLAQALCSALSGSAQHLTLDEALERLRRGKAALRNLLLERVPSRRGLLLIVDQLEELFVLSQDEQHIRHFDELLSHALDFSDGPLYLVTTVRSDFLARFPELPSMEFRLNTAASRYYLTRMTVRTLREAIDGPARLAGLAWESGLEDRLVTDAFALGGTRTPTALDSEVQAVPDGVLPLLGHTLRVLWERRDRGVLTHYSYQALGGLGGAIARSADSELNALEPQRREAALRLLVALVRTQRDNPDTRRSISRSLALKELGGGKDAEELLARLSGARDPSAPAGAPARPRLIVATGERVDLVHESLLRHWPTLRQAVTARRRELVARDDLETAAKLWDASGRQDGALPLEKQLAYYSSATGGSGLAGEFLKRALALDARRRVEQQQQQRRRHLLLLSVVAASALAAVLVVVAWQYQIAATEREHAQQAHSRERGARAQLLSGVPGSLVAAIQIGGQAVGEELLKGRRPSAQAIGGLLSALSVTPRRLPLGTHGGRALGGELCDDGRWAATRGKGGTVLVWRILDGRRVARLNHGSGLADMAFSPDCKRMATAGAIGRLVLWQVADGSPLAEVRVDGGIRGLAFSPQGKRVLAWDGKGAAWVWATAQAGEPVRLRGHSGEVIHGAFSVAGDRMLTVARNAATLWSSSDSRRLQRFESEGEHVATAAFTDRGVRVLTHDSKGTYTLYNLATGQRIVRVSYPQDFVEAAVISGDGNHFVVTGIGASRLWSSHDGVSFTQKELKNGKARAFSSDSSFLLAVNGHRASIWSVREGREIHALDRGLRPGREIREGMIVTAEFSSDGTRVLTVSSGDGVVTLWDLREAIRVAELTGHQGGLAKLRITPDAQRVLTVSGKGTVRLWGVSDGIEIADRQKGTDAELSPGGDRYLVYGSDQASRSYSTSDGTQVGVLPDGARDALQVLFSPDGTRIATQHKGPEVKIWRLEDGEPVVLRDVPDGGSPRLAGFDRAGGHLLTLTRWRGVRVWDALSGVQLHELKPYRGPLDHAAFSPDGELLLTASYSDRGPYSTSAAIWDGRSGRRMFELRGSYIHVNPIKHAEFSFDGQRVITCSDGEVQVWDTRDGKLKKILRQEGRFIAHATYSPDGRYLATAENDITMSGGNAWVGLWAAQDLTRVATLPGARRPIQTLVFSANSNALVAVSQDGIATVFTLDPEQLMSAAVRVLRAQPEWSVLGSRYERFLAP